MRANTHDYHAILFLLFLWLRTLGFDLARPEHKLIINNQETLLLFVFS